MERKGCLKNRENVSFLLYPDVLLFKGLKMVRRWTFVVVLGKRRDKGPGFGLLSTR